MNGDALQFFLVMIVMGVALRFIPVFANAQGTATPVLDCTDQPAGTPCDDGNYCTMSDQCDGTGACNGGRLRNCSYLNSPSNPCVVGVCEPQRGCELKVYAPGTPCDTDRDYCTLERCDDFGRCTTFNGGVVYCPEGTQCVPSSGQCIVPTSPPTPSGTESGSFQPTPSASSLPLPPDASPSSTSTISRSQWRSLTNTPSITPRPFWWIAPSPSQSGTSLELVPCEVPLGSPTASQGTRQPLHENYTHTTAHSSTPSSSSISRLTIASPWVLLGMSLLFALAMCCCVGVLLYAGAVRSDRVRALLSRVKGYAPVDTTKERAYHEPDL